MAIDKTIPIGGIIAPNSEFDTYPVTDPKYGLGGLRTVHSVADLSLIPSERRQEGMVVYVSAGATPNYYSYIDSTWVLLDSLSSFGGKWNSTYTSVCAASANWDEVYTAVTTYSASWNEGGTGASVDLSALASASGNWNSTYTSVCANSGDWESTYSTVCAFSALWASDSVSISGSNINLGVPEDGSLVDGAYLGWTPFRKVTDAIDDLNELVNNIFRSTFVKAVNFTASPTAGGAGTQVTLNIATTGNGGATRRYDIDWGNGDITTGTSTSTPSYTYASNVGSPYTVSVSAYNTDSWGAGSIATVTREGYIVIYTANPIPSFDLYRNESTGGTILTNNELWVKTSDTLYLKNTTQNTQSNTQNPRYTIYWNYSSDSTNVVGNGVAGGAGVSDARLSKIYSSSSGTGTFPVRLAVTRYDSANPSLFPPTQPEGVLSNAVNLKVYSINPTLPTALNIRNLAFSTSTQKLLAANFTDNIIGGAGTLAGNNIQRYTTGSATTNDTSPIAYVADNSIVTALVNGSSNGARTITYSTPSNNNGTFTSLTLSNFTDYGGTTKYDSSGNVTSFASSIYFPQGFYGVQARISRTIASISTGVNSYQLQYNNGSNLLSNKIEFVKDDLLTTPTINVGSALITQNTQGTLRYVSGVPYYNTGGIINVAGITFSNWIGQTYETGNPVTFSTGTILEGSGSLFSSNPSRSYSNLNGAVNYLNSGIPIAGTGQASPYAIGTQTLNINNTNTTIAARVQLSLTNVNGTTNSSSISDKIIQLHSATPTFNEEAIACSVAGNNTAAKRINTGWTGANPVFNSSINYFVNNAWSGAVTVAGTDEAIVRFNVLSHFITDLSTGYLPIGPNLNTGRSGNQFFRFAFTRSAAQNFTFAITAPGGIAGLWIAAPGTAIDTSSTLNKWIDGSINYAGTGVPGAGTGGNGSNGCASGTPVPLNTALTAGTPYTLTLGTENLSNATNNQLLVTIALATGDTITSLAIS